MLPLTLKYRSQDFDSIEGQALTRQVLKAASKAGRLSHAYLLTGPRGTGKTSMARIIAKAINCLAVKEDGNPCDACTTCVQIRQGTLMDLIEIDAASHTGVDNIRELIDKARFLPSLARKKVYIIDEVHMLSKPAFNALLKTLEEPPEHVHFILATTELDRVPDTIVSRCQTFRFIPIPEEDIIKRLVYVCDQEGITYERDALQLIANHSSGGLRDALTTLEKAIQEGNVALEHVRSLLGDGSNEAFDRLYAAVVGKDSSRVLTEILSLQATSQDPSGLERSWLRYLQGLLYRSVTDGTPTHPILYILDQSQATFDAFQGSSIPSLGMEVALLKCCQADRAEGSIPSPAMVSSPPVALATTEHRSPLPPPQSSPQEAGMTPSGPSSQVAAPSPLVLDAIRSGWMGFAMSLPPLVKPLIATSEPTALEGSHLTIEIGSRSYLERVNDRKTRSVLDDAFQHFFGSSPTFRFILREAPPSSASGSDAIEEALQVFS